MRVYISGPMTGLPDCNRAAFDAAAKRLAEQGLNTAIDNVIKSVIYYSL